MCHNILNLSLLWIGLFLIVHYKQYRYRHLHKEESCFHIIFLDYYAKWNKPVSERQIPHDLTYKWNLMYKINYGQNRIRGTEPWNRLTAVRGEVGTGWEKVKGWVKEHVCMTHGQEQGCGDWLWEWGADWVAGAKKENEDNCNRIKIKY